jgi:hypothetical protein
MSLLAVVAVLLLFVVLFAYPISCLVATHYTPPTRSLEADSALQTPYAAA